MTENAEHLHDAQDKQSRASRPVKAGQRLVDVRQAGVFLGVSPWTVRDLIWRGELPQVRVGRLIRVDLRDLESYVTKQKEQTPA